MRKLFCTIAVMTLLLAAAVLTASAQAPAATQPRATPAPGAGTIPEGRVAIISTEAFSDPKTGITRLVNAVEGINREFKPRGDEIQRLRGQYEQLVKDINATQNVADQKALAAKADQAKTLESDIKRKAEDAQRDYEKRLRDATEPISKDLVTALQAYARQRGITVLLDASKLGEAMLVVSDGVDITAGFIADYNGRNPAAGGAPARP